MPTLIRVVVLAFLILFASLISCWALLALFVSWFVFGCCQFSISFNYVFASISVHVVIFVGRVAISALEFSFVSGLCCAQLWLQLSLFVVRCFVA